MITTRGTILAVLLGLAAACAGAEAPGPPTAPAAVPVVPSPVPPGGEAAEVTFPPVAKPARIYVGVQSPDFEYHAGPLASRYVLHDDGTFALQYSSARFPFFEYRGTYLEAAGVVTFEWEG